MNIKKIYLAKFQKLEENRINTLLADKVYLSCVDSFNDPFEFHILSDGIINTEFETRNVANSKKFQEFAQNHGLNIGDSFIENLMRIARKTLKVCCFCKVDINFDINDECQFDSKITKDLKHWAIYSDDHKGFCTIYELNESIPINTQRQFFYEVGYKSSPIEILSSDFEPKNNPYLVILKKLFTTKADCWKDEGEIRLVLLDGEEKFEENSINGLKLTKIIFGFEADLIRFSVKIQELKSKFPNLEFYQATKEPKTYSLKIVLLVL
jgi:Protein of unknown function (DUF2971)